jgi:DNA-binding IclR family transcriptional regulator
MWFRAVVVSLLKRKQRQAIYGIMSPIVVIVNVVYHLSMDKPTKQSKPAKKTTDSSPTPQRVRPVPAVSRAVAILRLLSREREPMGVKAIAQSLGMVTSTALHILRVLVDERMVRVDPATKRYVLGTGLLSLARSVMESNPFVTLAQPAVDRISDKWHLSAYGVEVSWNPPQLVLVARSRLQNPYRLHVDLGIRFPVLCGATGRLIAAFNELPLTDIKTRFNEVKWHDAPEFGAWRKDVDGVRTKGYSLDSGEDVAGVYQLAAPVRDTRGHVTHSLVASMVGKQLARDALRQLATDLVNEASAIELALHGEREDLAAQGRSSA